MLKKLALASCLLTAPFMTLQAEETKVGYVDFKACLELSKQGQKERGSFDSLKKDMQEKLIAAEKELEEIAKKLEDQDYMDGLSPTAEEELKRRFQGMSQEFAHFQNQYYQLLNQANYKLLQSLHQYVSNAADKVREKERLALILNEETVFASSPSLNCTDAVIAEMDRRFDLENSNEELENLD